MDQHIPNDHSRDLITYRPIGIIRTGHTDADHTPVQSVYAQGYRGTAEILPEFVEGLRDLEGFSHVILLYHLHRVEGYALVGKPFLHDKDRGVFATRTPHRPNPIGLSVVRLLGREGANLHLDGVDILDGTPLLDIKPYIGRLDRLDGTTDGWREGVDEGDAADRGRRHQRETVNRRQ